MLKKGLISIILLLLIFAGTVAFYFDSIVKGGIEVVGSEVLGTGVSVAAVSISPLDGSGSISGLKIENPAGFSSGYVLELESISLKLNVASLFSDVVEIESIHIIQPAISYETKIVSDNIRTLLNNLSAGETAVDEASSETAGSAKRVIIREILILDPQLRVIAGFVTAPVPLPDIEMRNIGTEGDAMSMPAAVSAVLLELSTSILTNLPNLPNLAESVETGLEEGINRVEDVLSDTVDDLGSRLRGILN